LALAGLADGDAIIRQAGSDADRLRQKLAEAARSGAWTAGRQVAPRSPFPKASEKSVAFNLSC